MTGVGFDAGTPSVADLLVARADDGAVAVAA